MRTLLRGAGGRVGGIVGSLLLAGLAGALLFFYVFPWAEPQLPFGDVTVE